MFGKYGLWKGKERKWFVAVVNSIITSRGSKSIKLLNALPSLFLEDAVNGRMKCFQIPYNDFVLEEKH